MTKSRSLQRDLSIWIIAASIPLGGIAALAVAVVSFYEAREIQDNSLRQISQLLVSDIKSQIEPLQLSADVDHDDDEGEDLDEAILIRRLGEELFPPLPDSLANGFHTVEADGADWRVYVADRKVGTGKVAILQQTEFRDEIALTSSMSALIPVLVVMAVMLLAIHWTIRIRFKPLTMIASQLQNPEAVESLSVPKADIPLEVGPFVTSINSLLQRVDQTIHKQRRFIADASHELRTPVAALKLLVDSANRASNDDIHKERQKLVEQGIDRLSVLLNQLLDLARFQSDQTGLAQQVQINDIVQSVVAELYPLAEQQGVDLGVKNEIVEFTDCDGALTQLVRNAVDNAVRYTEAGGRVDISIERGSDYVSFIVDDTGVGIPEGELDKLYMPFHRSKRTQSIPGNGLGLSICYEVAQRLNGTITIKNRRSGGVRFRFRQEANY